MTVRDIRLFGDPVLTQPTERIDTIDDTVRALVRDLLDTVALPGRAGVAATQIGVGLAAFSYNVDGRTGYLLNPRITGLAGERVPTGEGCLSLPGLWYDTPRNTKATATGIDLEGREVVLEGDGVMAQALQHEIDHLSGILYIRRLEPPQRKAAMRELREQDWFLTRVH